MLLTLLYGYEAWASNNAARRWLETLEMSCSRAIYDVNSMQRIRSTEVGRQCGVTKSVIQTAE